ncbi:ribonuclease HII [Longibacter salinarum]|uniref:Ribonuclease HII n=1 Tax=Longibacter salinarum TaxID=1850348 RepID=A0A2A8CTJ6_9BACT|nr:ribonuclease HII [Longibacter salinarum]PEN10399.1 ribonuclease HII [Longibacter salinarum]
MLEHERRLWTSGYQYVAGLDEAGRGCLAGPVVAAAVILPRDIEIPAIQDSKSLSETKRDQAREQIEEQALAVEVGICSPQEIDELNILHASLEAMRRATNNLSPGAEYLLVDGNRWIENSAWPYETVVKGDATSQSIAAASIIAKTERDRMMRTLASEHPEYGWESNVGYPTKQHYKAIAQHGITSFHRQSFKLKRSA